MFFIIKYATLSALYDHSKKSVHERYCFFSFDLCKHCNRTLRFEELVEALRFSPFLTRLATKHTSHQVFPWLSPLADRNHLQDIVSRMPSPILISVALSCTDLDWGEYLKCAMRRFVSLKHFFITHLLALKTKIRIDIKRVPIQEALFLLEVVQWKMLCQFSGPVCRFKLPMDHWCSAIPTIARSGNFSRHRPKISRCDFASKKKNKLSCADRYWDCSEHE